MATKPTDEFTGSEEEKLIKLAKKRFELAQQYWDTTYKDMQTTLEFINGEQWDPQLKRNRENLGLPCLVGNMLPTYLRQITNESRQNCPSIQIDPKGDGADQQIAEIYADLIRSIEQSSGASTAYDNAAWYAAAVGLGFFRIISEYEDDKTDYQKLVIKTIPDPTTVLLDPEHKEIDGSDCEYVFIVQTMTKDEFRRTFPNSRLEGNNFKSWDAAKSNNLWIGKDDVTIAEYYYKEYEPFTLYKVKDNSTGETRFMDTAPDKNLVTLGIIEILATRDAERTKVRWVKMNAVEVLEETEWVGKYIPVIAVKGDETWIEGKRELKGAVKDAIDSQRVYNYNYSVMAEAVAMAPKAPWIVEARQIENHEHLWRDANNSTLAYLPYNFVEGASPPSRATSEPAVQAAIAAMHEAADAIKAVFGMTALNGQQTGGPEAFRTVLARQQQEHTTTYHYYDNLVKAVEQCGTILVETIPIIYADMRSVQTVTLGGKASNVMINNTSDRDVTKGDYGVVVETGPSYATRRQDSVVHMLDFAAANPNLQLGDIIAEESDWPGSKRIADRIKLFLPPEIQQAEAMTGQADPKAALQQAVMQNKTLKQQLQQVQQAMQELIAHNKATDDIVKTQHHEILLTKAEAHLNLEKHDKEMEIKQQQLTLDELETELSYKIKKEELELQKRQMAIEEAKLGIETVATLADINSDIHDHTMDHHDKMVKLHLGKNPTKTELTGPDSASFETLSGTDVSNA